MTATDPTTAQPATPGLDLEQIDAELDEVRANVDHGEAQYNPNALMALRAGEGLVAEVRRLRELTATCTCGTSPMTYEGPEADCPVHGAVRAFNEVSRELERLRGDLDDARTEIDRLSEDRGEDWAEEGDRLRAEVERLRGLADHQEHHLGASHSNPPDELDAAPAAPATYALPAEPPPEVTELWEVSTGRRWEREEFPGYVRWRSEDIDGEWRGWLFRQFYELLARGPLSSVPPAGTEGDQ